MLLEPSYVAHARLGATLMTRIAFVGDFADNPGDLSTWDERSVGQLLLRTAVQLIARRVTQDAAPESMQAALHPLTVTHQPPLIQEVRHTDLKSGVILEQELVNLRGTIK
jgi:hypothetical protein